MGPIKYLLIAFSLTAGYASYALDVLPKSPPIPRNNPMTGAKVKLGKQLYFDTRWSSDNKVSCNTCHNVQGSGTDNLRVSKGIKGLEGGRNAPTVWNSAFLSAQFWDGRAKSLEEQAKGPLTNPIEHGMKDHNAVIAVVNSIPGYVQQFKKVFRGQSKPVNIDNFAKAIAAYERTLLTPNSPVDQFVAGNKKALSAAAQRGLLKFQSLGCVTCHNGPNYAGPTLPEGVGFYQKFPTYPDKKIEAKYKFQKDKGRFEVTKNKTDIDMWRVPSLRNIALTAPYFHNGSVKTLKEAVKVMAKLQRNQNLSDKDANDLVAFLKGLTGKRPKQPTPKLPKSAE